VLYQVVGATGAELAKEAMWLAWKACGGPKGMGVFQDRPLATKVEVVAAAAGAYDYGGSVHKQSGPGTLDGDYVFGRMMKLRMQFAGNEITLTDGPLSPGYHDWDRLYPSYEALLIAAAESLGVDLLRDNGLVAQFSLAKDKPAPSKEIE